MVLTAANIDYVQKLPYSCIG